MTWNEYKEACKKFASYPKRKELEYLTLGLFNEIGELLGVEKKSIRGDYGEEATSFDLSKYRKAILGELGDICWYLAMINNYFFDDPAWDGIYQSRVALFDESYLMVLIPDEINIWDIKENIEFLATDWYDFKFEDILQYNIDKLEDRLQRDVIKGSGDER